MSEYQYYEFLAIDRPLDEDEQADVRSLSTRASISATSFVNEYHWGDFKGVPDQLVELYYDAHLYVANWGTHRLLLRLPGDILDLDVCVDYCVDSQVNAWDTDEFVVLEFLSEDEAGEFDFDTDPHSLLSAIIGVRTELADGDLRPLYLAWLAAYGAWERDEDVFDREADDDLEPPVPPGLGRLTAAQRALADFLRLDDDLIAIAAETSPPPDEVATDPDDLAEWVTRLPVTEKDRLLARVATGEGARVRRELLSGLRKDTAPQTPVPPRRTVADLLDNAARRRAEHERLLDVQRAEEQARLDEQRRKARERRLDRLAEEEEAAWSRVDAMITSRKPSEYDSAVVLLTDLQALAERENRRTTFTRRASALRREHARKPSLIGRFDKAGI